MPRSRPAAAAPCSRARARLRVVLGLVLTVLACPGCAVGAYGALVARYTQTPTAVVVDVYSAGLHVRPLWPERGASVGFRHAAYVFPRPDRDAGGIGTVWTWFRAPLPEPAPLVRTSTVVGIETQATSEVARVAIGYLDQVLTIGPGPEASRIVMIDYDRRDPTRTRVHIEETP